MIVTSPSYGSIKADDIRDVRMCINGNGWSAVELTGGPVLYFDTAADLAAFIDRLVEMAHAVPEVAAAWSTYPVVAQ